METMTTERLQAFNAAWNAHDADAVMGFFTDDCVYHASSGPDLMGATYRGRDEVRAAVVAFLERFPDAHFVGHAAVVTGDQGFTEWTFTATAADGQAVRFRGCDLFSFDGDRVAVKNAFPALPIFPGARSRSFSASSTIPIVG